MKHRHRIIVAAIAAVSGLLAIGPAHAKSEPAANGALTKALSTPADSAAGLASRQGSFARLAATTCWSKTASRTGKNVFGMTLWTYYQRIDWCASAGKITSVTRDRWPGSPFLGWAWKGHISSSTSGGKGAASYRAVTQGHFCLAEFFSCVQNSYPRIDMTVRANGSWSYVTSG